MVHTCVYHLLTCNSVPGSYLCSFVLNTLMFTWALATFAALLHVPSIETTPLNGMHLLFLFFIVVVLTTDNDQWVCVHMPTTPSTLQWP